MMYQQLDVIASGIERLSYHTVLLKYVTFTLILTSPRGPFLAAVTYMLNVEHPRTSPF